MRSITNQSSTIDYYTFLRRNLVTWRSKKQSVVSLGSVEAGYRALAQSIFEGLWLKEAISIAKNPVHLERTKHVELKRHFIKEEV
ncbi:Copia protein [Gossypium australe]|uniref:Copia protein n=1 Tax=Gossypium australe TaxID=47621 RepID=A0A5B6WEH2_9ROSI|nr:Copia protein [Gossypium australe]